MRRVASRGRAPPRRRRARPPPPCCAVGITLEKVSVPTSRTRSHPACRCSAAVASAKRPPEQPVRTSMHGMRTPSRAPTAPETVEVIRGGVDVVQRTRSSAPGSSPASAMARAAASAARSIVVSSSPCANGVPGTWAQVRSRTPRFSSAPRATKAICSTSGSRVQSVATIARSASSLLNERGGKAVPAPRTAMSSMAPRRRGFDEACASRPALFACHSSNLGIEGRVALVAGASRGIGRATALALAREGADVYVLGRDAMRLGGVCEEIGSLGRRAHPIAVNVATRDALRSALDHATGTLGPPTLLVLSIAAVFTPERLERWRRDRRSPARHRSPCADRSLPLHAPGDFDARFGRIVAVGSLASRVGTSGGALRDDEGRARRARAWHCARVLAPERDRERRDARLRRRPSAFTSDSAAWPRRARSSSGRRRHAGSSPRRKSPTQSRSFARRGPVRSPVPWSESAGGRAPEQPVVTRRS